MATGEHESSFTAKITQLFALYVIYVFLSGWTFLDYYFREFSVDPRWLDFPVQEILVKGFTILFTGGYWLWPIYAAMLLVPLLIDGTPRFRRRLTARILTSCFLFLVLIAVYFASRSAATAEAAIDKSAQTRLPVILFSRKPPCPSPTAGGPPVCNYSGTALAVRNGLVFVHHVTEVGKQEPSIAVSVFRVEDLADIKLVEH